MIAISFIDLWLVSRADNTDNALKPLITSFPGRVVYAINSFLSLSGLCRIVVKIHVAMPGFEPQKMEWIDSNFVGIVTMLSYNTDFWLRYFLGPLRGIGFDFACGYADKFPRAVPVVIRDRF
jgi:hypothetical protein